VTLLRNLLAVSLLLLMQGPAVLLQEVAWVKMLISYSQENGLKRGVIETFDGAHPCALCKKVEKMRQQKDEDPSTPKNFRPSLVWDAMIAPAGRLLAPLPKYKDYLVVAGDWQQCPEAKRTDGPELPPPELG
jgi:hypothetical protein